MNPDKNNLTKEQAYERVDAAIEKFLFDSGESYPVDYVKSLDMAMKVIKQELGLNDPSSKN